MISSHVSAFACEPQVAVLIFHHRTEPVRSDSRGITLVEHGEAHAVKARHSIQSSDPKITVRSLGDASNDVLRKPVLCRPPVKAVLRGYCGADAIHDQEARYPGHGRLDGEPPPPACVG